MPDMTDRNRQARLRNRVALVTGGSRGIGAATALALAEAGADVAISYRAAQDRAAAVQRAVEACGVRGAAFRADQSRPAEVEALVHAVLRDFGQLDVLVNNAAVFVAGAVDDPDANLDGLALQARVNIGGVVSAIRAAARVMGRDGRIITVGSAMAGPVGFPGLADHAATKAAVAAYSRGAARDLGAAGITVNVVQPCAIETDPNPSDGPFAAEQIARNALGRFGRPEEVAAGIVFLAGPEASFITGAVLNIDGGFAA
jgi:3-oxoacyl-[acyl-carrier protein] reductase